MTFKNKWEKTQASTELSNKIIYQMIESFYPKNTIKCYTIINGGCANINIKVDFVDLQTPILLRIYLRDKNSAWIEQKIALKLKKNIPIPQIYHIGKVSRYTFAIAEFINGLSLREILLKDKLCDVEKIMHKIGSLLGEIATIKFDKSGLFNKELKIYESFNQSGYVQFCLNSLKGTNVQSILSKEKQKTIHSIITKNAHFFPDGSEKNLVHADFDPANILVNDQGEISGILDWEFAYSGSTVADIANMLRYAHHMPKSFQNGFLDGLASSGYKLPTHFKQTMHLLNLMSLLDSVNRTKLTRRPNQIKDIKELISHIINIFEAKKSK